MASAFANLIHVKACNFHRLLSLHYLSCLLSLRTAIFWNPQLEGHVIRVIFTTQHFANWSPPLTRWRLGHAVTLTAVGTTRHLSPDFLAVALQQKSRSLPTTDASKKRVAAIANHQIGTQILPSPRCSLQSDVSLSAVSVWWVSKLSWAGRQPGRPQGSFVFLLTRKVHREWHQKCECCPL